METTIEYGGYIGIMEKKMETTILLCTGVVRRLDEATRQWL